MKELPFLLKLADDPSPAVREKVARRLRALGPEIWEEMRKHGISLSVSQRLAVEEALSLRDDDFLRVEWVPLWAAPEGLEQLENGLLLIAGWQAGDDTTERGRQLLDDLAAKFQGETAEDLARFLFEEKALGGAQPDDYYNPLHSNLTYVLESGRGLPITLTSIFMLVGGRVGLQIEGCAFPGHFLARDARSARVFDPFNGGRPLTRGEIITLEKAAPHEMRGAASSREILARVLRNLAVAYHQDGEFERAQLMVSLLHENEQKF